MSTEIDKRVVEMQFNNKDFEKNAQASLTTIEKLKMALNFDGAKGLESLTKAANKVDLSNISKSADAVAVKFSAMQIAGVTAIQQLTLSFMNFGKTLWNSSFGQIKSGGMARALKIEQANFQMRALANNMYDVEKEADKINSLLNGMADAIDRSVSGTAYGYDAAASVASQLMASGLTDADKMYEHLRAIAGAAAMTGRDFENIGDIFTKVSSNGRLMTMELRQFAAAGLNMSSVLADFYGTTEQAVNDMVHDGKVSFEDFSEAVYKAFGEMAGKADETFSGVSKNVKAQLSRIGQLFAQPYIKNMIPFLQTVKAKLKEINNALAPIANTFDTVFGKIMTSAKESLEQMDLFRLNTIFGGIENILTSIFLIAVQVKKAFDEVFPKKTLDELHEIAIEFNNITLSLIPSLDTLNGLKELIRLPLIIAKTIFKAIKSVFRGLKPIISAVKNLLGAIVRFGEVFTSLNNTILYTVNSTNMLETIFVSIGTVIGYVINLVANLVDVFRTLLVKLLNSAMFQSILSFLSSVVDAIERGLAVALYLIVSIIGYIFSTLDFNKIITALSNIKGFAVTVFGYLINFLKYIITFIFSVLTGITSIGKGISVLSDYFKKGVSNIKSFFSSITDGEKTTENVMDNLLDAFIRIKERFDGLFEGLTAGKVLLIAFGVGVVLLVFALERLVKNLAELAKHANVAFSVFDILKNGVARAIQISPMLQVLIGMAVAIGAVTASIITLGRDLSSEELKRSVTALSIFIVLLTTISIMILKIGKTMPKNLESMKNIIGAIGSFSLGILALSFSLKILTSMEVNLKNLVVSLGAITVLIGELGGIALILGQNFQKINKEKEDIKYVSVNFIGLALSVLTLTGALRMLSTINPEKVIQSLISFMVVMGMFGTVILIAGDAAKKGLGFKAGLGITLIVSSLTTIFLVLLGLSFIPFDKIGKSVLKMLAIMVPLTTFIAVIGELILKGSKLDKSRNIEVLKAMTKMLSLFALTMAELTIIVAALGKMSLKNLIKGITAVTIMSFLIDIVVTKFITVSDKMFKEFGKSKDGYKNFNASLQNIAKMISSFALVMLAISASAMMLDNVSFIGFIMSALAFAEVVFTMQYLIREAEKTKDAKMGPLLAIAVSILAIMSAIALIAYSLKGSNLQDTTTNALVFEAVALGISLVLSCFALVLNNINANKFQRPEVVKTFKAGTKNVELLALGIAAILVAIAGIGLAFKVDDIEKMYYSAIILLEVLSIIGVVVAAVINLSKTTKGQSAEEATKIMQAQTDRFKSIYSLLIGLAGFVLSIGASMSLLSYVSKDNMTSTIVSSIIVIFAVIAVLITLVSYVIPELQELAENVSEKEKFSETFDSISNLMMTLMKGMIGLVAVISLGSSLVGYTKSFWSFIASIGMLAVLFGGLLGPIIVMIEQMKDLNEDKFNQVIQIIDTVTIFVKNLLRNLSLLAAAIAVMSLGGNIESLITSFGGIIVIMIGIWGMIITFSKMLGDKNIAVLQTLDKFMVAFGISMALICAGLVAIALTFNSIYDADVIISSLVALGLIMVALTASVIVMSRMVKENDVKTLLAASASVVIITLSLIAIAGSIKMLYNTMAKDNYSNGLEKLGKIIVSFVVVIFSLAAVVGAVVALSKSMNGSNIVNVAGISLLILTITASIIAIAGAIKIMDNVNIGPGAAASFVSVGAIIAAMVSVVTGLSKNANWAVLGSAALLVASFGAAAIAMAVTIKMLVSAFSGISKEQMSNIVLVFISFEIIVGLLVGIFAALGAAIGENAMAVSLLIASFAGAVASFGLSAILFGAGVTLFAEGVNRLFEVIQTINDLEIDAHRVHDNIQKGIMGIAQGIWDSLGYIAQALTGIVITILEVAVASIAVIAGIAAVIMAGFAMGLIMALPILLVAISAILAAVAEWGKEEENIQLLYDAGYTLGSAIVAGIFGAIDGMGSEFIKRLADKVPTFETLKEYIEAKNTNKKLEEDNYIYEDEYGIKHRARGRYNGSLKEAAERNGMTVDEYTEYTKQNDSPADNNSKTNGKLKEHKNKQAQKYVKDLINNYKEYKKTQDEVTESTRTSARANENLTMSYVDLGQEASIDNKVHVSTKNNLQGISEEGNNLIDTIDSVGNAMEKSSEKTDAFSRGVKTAKESIKENGTEIAKEASGNLLKSVGDDLVNEYAPDILVKLKNKFGDSNIDWDLVSDVITGKVDKSELFKSFLSNGILSGEAFKTGLNSQLTDLAAMFNIDLTNVKTYEQWEAYGNEKAYYEGHVERWRAMGYDSAAAYADAMQKEHGTVGEALIKGFFGDENPLEDITKSSEDAIKNMTDSLNGLGDAEDEAAKKTNALADSVSNALDIFSEFNDTAEMTGHDVLKSFMSQITGVSKWSTELKALAGKGFSQALLEDLASLGPQGYEKVHALYTMSAKEMSLFNKMYEKKLSLESSTAKDILASFEGNVSDIAEVYGEELPEQMQQATAASVKQIGEGVVSEMAAIPEQAGTAIGEAAFPLTNAFAELGMSSMEAFKKQLDFEEALEAVKVFQAGIIDSTTLGSKLFDELGESEEISSKKMLDNMKRQVMNVGEWVSEINTLVARGASEGLVNQLMEMGPEGKAKVDAFVKMTDSELKEANRLYEASAKLPQVSADRITKSYAQAGYNASLGFTEGIDPEAAQTAMYMLAEHSLEYLEAALDINSPSKKTMEIGVYTVEGFIAGIINETSKYKLRNACASITTIIKDSFKNNLSATAFRSIADDCMAGLANGIMASATDAAIKAAEAAKKVTEAVKNAFDTHSPSLIFKWIGEMLMLGLGDGIIAQSYAATETATLTAKNVIDNVMAKIASMSEYDEQAYTPVIRPVVDMSNVDSGYNDIRSWFDQQGSISMMGNIRLNTNNENGSSDVNRIVDAINGISNQDVVDEIASLRNDISTLQDSMSRLQVVMDTGSLVGQLVQPMDQALGVRAVTNSRGRYS